MKTLPTGMQVHLDSKATTLCWCWRITRTDSTKLGFTDHDEDLTFDSTTFEAATGFTASEIKQTLGLSVDDLDAAGALSSAKLDEGDLSAGLYDDAAIEVWRVNWSDTDQRVLMVSGSIGEVRRGNLSFVAELRSLAHYLSQPTGRIYQYACDADLGDTKCAVDTDLAVNKGTGTTSVIDNAYHFKATGLSAFDDAWFSGGLLTWTSGVNNGRVMEVKYHIQDGAIATIELWRSMPDTPSIGDTFTVTAGCDKTFETCKDKFSNGDNFRGCPHIPGSNYMIDVASQSSFAKYSGESMFNE